MLIILESLKILLFVFKGVTLMCCFDSHFLFQGKFGFLVCRMAALDGRREERDPPPPTSPESRGRSPGLRALLSLRPPVRRAMEQGAGGR